MKFGEKVKHLMELRQMSPDELAKRIGLSASYVYSITNGTRDNPPLKTIDTIASALGVDPGYLINEKAIDFQELSRISGVDLSADIVQFITSQKSLPYLELAKYIEENDIPLSSVQRMIEILKDNMKK